VVQMNKRDLVDVFSLRDLGDLLNHTASPILPAAAINGIGVFETLKAVCKQVIAKTS